jgi:anaerobic magnesium-protoporphyrin IX monomethyl ester cyclase
MTLLRRLALVAFENEISWGLRRMAQFLRSRGFDVRLYFLGRYANLPRGVPEATRAAFLEDFSPQGGDIVGISFMTPYLEVARNLSLRVKSRGGVVVVGGTHPTIVPGDCLPFADYVVRGEGEEALSLLLQELQAGSSPPRGVFRKENDFWFNENPDQFPYPRYGEIPDTIIVQGQVQRTGEVPRQVGPLVRYQTFTSFGCPYVCTYCVNPLLQQLSGRKGKKFLRRRNMDDVLSELLEVREKIDTVGFEDEDFLVDTERALSFLDRYRKEIGLPFTCLVTPATLDLQQIDFLARELRKARCVAITIGLQSGSSRTAALFRRPFNLDRIRKIARALTKEKIMITYDLIIGNPFEDESDKEQTVKALLSLPHPFEVNVFFLSFFPGYLLTQKALEQGIPVDRSLDTRTVPREESHPEEVIIRLAQWPFFPRAALAHLYERRKGSGRWLIPLFGSILLPLVDNRWTSILRIGLVQPKILLTSAGRWVAHFFRRKRPGASGQPQ